MALSFKTVQDAYVILNDLNKSSLFSLSISSFPEDMQKWDFIKREKPPLNVVFGFDRKADDGWENLVFFVESPTDEMIESFKGLNTIRSNSSICRRYTENSEVWIMGWF